MLQVGLYGLMESLGHDLVSGCIWMNGVVHQVIMAYEALENIGNQTKKAV
jgi:hypothetical protein